MVLVEIVGRFFLRKPHFLAHQTARLFPIRLFQRPAHRLRDLRNLLQVCLDLPFSVNVRLENFPVC